MYDFILKQIFFEIMKNICFKKEYVIILKNLFFNIAPVIAAIASTVAAITSAKTARKSSDIAKNNYEYLRNKEALNIAIVPNKELKEISVIKNNANEKTLKIFLEKYYFEIINLSSLPINMLKIDLDIISLNNNLFNDETNLASHFSTLGGSSYNNPNVVNLQQYDKAGQFQQYSMSPHAKEKIEIPLSLLKEFLQFSYQIEEESKPLVIENELVIKIIYYSQITTKIEEIIKSIPYKMSFGGTRAIIKFEFEPKIIYLHQ